MWLAVCNQTLGNITTYVQSLHQEGRCVKDSLLGPQDAYRYVECPNHDETLTFAQIFGLSLTGLRRQTHQQLAVLRIRRPGLCWRFRRFDRMPKRHDKQNELNIDLARTHELTISASYTITVDGKPRKWKNWRSRSKSNLRRAVAAEPVIRLRIFLGTGTVCG